MKLLRAYNRNPGDGKPIAKEEALTDIKLRVYKFNNRLKPDDKNKILFITCFSEFGCESLALLYCIPKITRSFPGMYIICVGWFGREYLYRHLVDEYWEIDESLQWLREHSSAFKSSSKNISRFEESLNNYGKVYRGVSMGSICLGNACLDCGKFWEDEQEKISCPSCASEKVERALLSDVMNQKKKAVPIPRPGRDKLLQARKYLKPNAVGIFARGRIMYGRNLRPEFYVKLIELLESRGYNPIWLGEKQSVLPCPVDHITDFSRLPESRDLELTLALISQLQFTIQFWTASTRLASMVDIPWILFESPDQIVGHGQEGKRIALTTDFDKKKLVLCGYHNVMENENGALELVTRSIDEMKKNCWDDIIGLVNEPEIVQAMLMKQQKWWSYDNTND